LVGGPSSEHEVSLSSGRVVHKHIDHDKYEVIPIVIGRKGDWPIEQKQLPDVADVAFVMMHGEYGEDGTIQEILRDLNMPYTWSDVMASSLAMNKPLSYRAFRAHGMDTPESKTVSRHNFHDIDYEIFDLPAIVKPADRGSSVGVSLVRRISDLKDAVEKALTHSKTAMVEKFIPGKEFTCGVLDDSMGGAFPLPVTQIFPRTSNFFDYHAKYVPGASHEVTPAQISKEEAERIQATALRAHQAVGASGASRTDMILGEDGELYVLEVNTIPGMTETSLLPQGAIAHGISISELLDRIIESAFIRHKSIY